MPQDNGQHREYPDKPGVDYPDMDHVIGRAEQIPAESERVRGQGDDQLTLYQQEAEEVSVVVGQGNGY